MGGIENDHRPAGEYLDAAGPVHLAQAAAEGRVGDGPAPRPEHFQGDNRLGGVAGLVFAVQCQREPGPLPRTPAHIQVVWGRGVARLLCHRSWVPRAVEVAIELEERRSPLGTGVGNHPAGVGVQGPRDHGDTGPDDAGFLPGDCRDGLAQLPGVVEPNGSDHADQWLAEVGRIEPATEPHFQHHKFRLLIEKVQPAQRGGDFEVSGPQLARQAVEVGGDLGHSVDQAGQLGTGGGAPIDGQPLFKSLQVRRREECGADARRFQDPGDHDRGGALPLGAGEMHGGESILRVAQPLEQVPHPFEVNIARLNGPGQLPLEVDSRRQEFVGLPECGDADGHRL